MVCDDAAGEAEAVAHHLELYWTSGRVPPSEMAVMYRTNAQSRSFEEACVRKALPFVVVGAQRFYERREARRDAEMLLLVMLMLMLLLMMLHFASSLNQLRNTQQREQGAKHSTWRAKRQRKKQKRGDGGGGKCLHCSLHAPRATCLGVLQVCLLTLIPRNVLGSYKLFNEGLRVSERVQCCRIFYFISF